MKAIEALFARSSLTLDQYAEYMQWGGNYYPLTGAPRTTLGSKVEEPEHTFQGLVEGAYRRDGIVFACILARMLLFAEARFQFRRRIRGRPGSLFGTRALRPLEEPWPGGTTGELLSRMIQDVDLAGNWYAVRRPGGRIMRLRPDWVTIVLGSPRDPEVGFGHPDAEVLGYIYEPGGKHGDEEAIGFLPHEVAHWAPIPDPLAAYRGMSWLTPVIRDVLADRAATDHKMRFFEQGATVNLVITLDRETQRDSFEKWVDLFERRHKGATNAFKTLYLAAGADAKAIGADLKQADLREVQGAGETRIAAAAGVPPVIAGFSEGLKAATYSNYGQARRRFADLTMRPLWRSACGVLQTLIDVPAGAELWYDAHDIPFLQEDEEDKAKIQATQAQAIKALVEAGYTPESAVAYIDSDDLTVLQHTGLFSVQLQEPGANPGPEPQPETGPET